MDADEGLNDFQHYVDYKKDNSPLFPYQSPSKFYNDDLNTPIGSPFKRRRQLN